MRTGDAQRWLAAIVDSSDDAIIGKRLDGTIVSWNAAAERIFGYTAEEMIGQSVIRLFPPELVDEEKDLVAQLVRGERVNHFETTRVRKDGTRIAVSLSVSPILDAGGTIIGAANITREVTEANRIRSEMRNLNARLEERTGELQRQLQETAILAQELEETNERLHEAVDVARQAQSEAEAASRAKGDFLATMSHELRTPLNAISGYADLMDSGVFGDLAPEYRGYVDRIRHSQRHLLELISAVLDFSKLEAGGLELSAAVVPVADVLSRLELMTTPLANAKTQQLRVERPADQLCIKGDRERALQILLNLVGNAVKFTPPGGAITVNAGADSDAAVAIRVRDNGPGIAEDNLKRIFDPFVQLDYSLTRGHQGAGLGLAISRDLARAMGGDVTAQSNPGEGSTFTLTLPRANP